MKKYLILAVILGSVSFFGASYLAHAQDAAAGAAATTAPAAPTAEKVMPAAPQTAYAKDRAECDAVASMPATEGETPDAAAKSAALKKCLIGKGHSEDEITKEESVRGAADAAPADASAPAAPADGK